MRAALRGIALGCMLACCALQVASSRARHAPRPTTLHRAALRESGSVLMEGEYRLNVTPYKPLEKWQVVALTQVIEYVLPSPASPRRTDLPRMSCGAITCSI
jgi:hypothetical protein